MNGSQTSDVDLFERLRAGDAGALEPPDGALRGPRVSRGQRGRAALGTWLYRIAVNTALNKRRGKRNELEEPLEDLLPTFKEDGHRQGDRSFLLADCADADLRGAGARRRTGWPRPW